ncbi:MAG: TonB-system energizer ExbB [Helicobacteraceae bacterium]|jgi:biopolymer transport protein ExbB|nr:TonB-system energizer ExbB [Helicobacteraceae bacterium]
MIEKELIEYIIFGILAVMGFIAVWIVIERLIYYKFVRLNEFDSKELLEIALTKNLSLLASIAVNAPYIGLLGTVAGIMMTFIDIAADTTSIDPSVIMVGLALALKATAFGLIVAIPSSFVYNLLVRKSDILLTLWETREAKKD